MVKKISYIKFILLSAFNINIFSMEKNILQIQDDYVCTTNNIVMMPNEILSIILHAIVDNTISDIDDWDDLINFDTNILKKDIVHITATCRTFMQFKPELDQRFESFIPSVIIRIIRSGSNINDIDNIGMTPLMRATLVGRTDIVESLLDAQADINIKDIANNTALIYAVNSKYHDIEKLIMNSDIYINNKNKNTKTSLILEIKKWYDHIKNHDHVTELILKSFGI